MFPPPSPMSAEGLNTFDADSSMDMSTPSGLYYRGSPYGRNAIDYSKFKTKVCRHYAMGLQCPFEDRCAFAHGEAIPQPPPPPPPSYTETLLVSGSADESPEESRPPTPPAYPRRYRNDPYSALGVVLFAN